MPTVQIPCGKRNYLIAAEVASGVREWVSAIHAAIRRARGLTSAVSDRINGRLSCKGTVTPPVGDHIAYSAATVIAARHMGKRCTAPYVVLLVDRQQFHTSTSTSPEPIWNEIFDMYTVIS